MRWTPWPFRILMTLAALLLFDQAVFAGQFLAGSFGAVHTHRENATYAEVRVTRPSPAAPEPTPLPGR